MKAARVNGDRKVAVDDLGSVVGTQDILQTVDAEPRLQGVLESRQASTRRMYQSMMAIR